MDHGPRFAELIERCNAQLIPQIVVYDSTSKHYKYYILSMKDPPFLFVLVKFHYEYERNAFFTFFADCLRMFQWYGRNIIIRYIHGNNVIIKHT